MLDWLPSDEQLKLASRHMFKHRQRLLAISGAVDFIGVCPQSSGVGFGTEVFKYMYAPHLSVCHITGAVCCSLLTPHECFSWGIFRDGCYVSGTCHVISTGTGRERKWREGDREAIWKERKASFLAVAPTLLCHTSALLSVLSYFPFSFSFILIQVFYKRFPGLIWSRYSYF